MIHTVWDQVATNYLKTPHLITCTIWDQLQCKYKKKPTPYDIRSWGGYISNLRTPSIKTHICLTNTTHNWLINIYSFPIASQNIYIKCYICFKIKLKWPLCFISFICESCEHDRAVLPFPLFVIHLSLVFFLPSVQVGLALYRVPNKYHIL